MKKSKKFVTFRLFNAGHIITAAASLLLVCAIFFSLSCLLPSSVTPGMINLMLHLGSQTEYTPPHINIAQAVLTVSLPGVVFSEPAAHEPHPAEPPSETVTEPVTIPIAENTAQSITYKSAEEKGYTSTDGIYINNQTSKKLDIAALLSKELDLSLSAEPSVLIVHTHTSESYTPSAAYNYIPSEADRTLDSAFNMIAVGEVIYNALTAEGINTIHDKTINDHPSYSTSYSKSLKLVESYTSKYPSIKIVIDVHRDAIVSASGSKMRPLADLSPPCAQVMMVVGTNDSGLNHPLWQTNLSFVLKLQHKMNSLYPTLARPVNLRRERFNHHTAPYAFILEVGTNGNTLDEAKEGALLFSKSLVSLLKV